MSSELKEETLKAFKTGINFLEKIKATICNNDLTNTLDQVYYIFEELVQKWESEVIINSKPKTKNFVKLANSTPMKPTKIEIEKRMSSDVTPSYRDELLNSVEERKHYKKENKLVFQQLRSRSKSEENIIDSHPAEKKLKKKRSSILDLVRMPVFSPKNADVEQYVSMKGIDSDMIMHSNENNFCKITKIKLKVNNIAVGARYCCLLGKNVVLGRELNDQVAEYALDLGEYRLENRKNQYFELVKKDITNSFRFYKESESADWYHCLSKIIDSEVYSYIPVSRGYEFSVNHKAEGERKNKLPYPIRQSPEYDYPEFQIKKEKDLSRSNVENNDIHSKVQYKCTEVHQKQAKWRISLPPDDELTRSHCLKKENARELGIFCENTNSSTGMEKRAVKTKQFGSNRDSAKIAIKTPNKLMRERSMSM